jgi:hypothetical protein
MTENGPGHCANSRLLGCDRPESGGKSLQSSGASTPCYLAGYDETLLLLRIRSGAGPGSCWSEPFAAADRSVVVASAPWVLVHMQIGFGVVTLLELLSLVCLFARTLR